MSKSSNNLTGFNFCRCLQFFCHRNDRRKIFFAARICYDMRAARVARSAGCEYPSLYFFAPRRNNAIGRKQNWAVESFELAHLFPPSVPVVPHEVVIFLEKRIIMSRQHLTMCVHIDPCAFCLFQQLLQVSQVVARY